MCAHPQAASIPPSSRQETLTLPIGPLPIRPVMLECHCPTHRRSRVVCKPLGRRQTTRNYKNNATPLALAELDKQRLELRLPRLDLARRRTRLPPPRSHGRVRSSYTHEITDCDASQRDKRRANHYFNALATPAPQILARRKPSSGQTKSHNTPQTKRKRTARRADPPGNQHARYAEAPEEEKEVHGAQAQMRHLSVSVMQTTSFRMRSDKRRKRCPCRYAEDPAQGQGRHLPRKFGVIPSAPTGSR